MRCGVLARLMAAVIVAVSGSAIRADATVDILRIDFGLWAAVEPGYGAAGTRTHDDSRFGWLTPGLEWRDRAVGDLLRRDFVAGSRGEFIVALDNGTYHVSLILGDQSFAHGPVELRAQDVRIVSGLVTAAGQHRMVEFEALVTDERLRLRFEGHFALNALVLRGVQQQAVHHLFGDPPPRTSPTLDELLATGPADPRAALHEACEFLLRNRRPDGFLEANSSEWYRSAYPMLTLLAGFEVFGDRRYLRAVTDLLDKLVDEQLPNGAWSSLFADAPVSQRSPQEVAQVMSWTTNTADTGTVATCLSAASRFVDAPRRRRYIEAHRRYADEYVRHFQLPSGAFGNGRWLGQDLTFPYSVATGVQAMSFTALHAATGEPHYLEIAERAVDWLLRDTWLEDGRVVFHPHDSSQALVLPATSFGTLHYFHDGIQWVWHWTRDEALRDRIREAYARHVHGSAGLLAARQHGVWWQPSPNAWENSKAGGIPRVLITFGRDATADAEVAEAVERCAAFLAHRAFALRIGVTEDSRPPWGEFSIPSTGFAGLTLAELTAPGIVYMRAPVSGAGRRAIHGPAALFQPSKRRPAAP